MDNKISETDEEAMLTHNELKDRCFVFARKNFQGKRFVNKDT
jgi:hypothetical protein